MINFKEYTKNTYSHVPRGYMEEGSVFAQICDKNNGRAVNCAFDSWLLGFERAYRAAKAGKLDFQQGGK